MSLAPVIHIQNIQHQWPHSAQALKVDHWQLHAGESLWLRGPSGSGKSTLLSLLAGVLAPQSGQLWVAQMPMHGVSASARDRTRRQHVGWIAQQFNLLPYWSARDNALLPWRLHKTGGLSLAQAQQRLASLAHAFGLQDSLLDRPARTLSVGQQQRVAAMRALLLRPALILADEPTSALDVEHAKALMATLQAQASEAGAALVVASHDPLVCTSMQRCATLVRRDTRHTVLEESHDLA